MVKLSTVKESSVFSIYDSVGYSQVVVNQNLVGVGKALDITGIYS